MLSDYCKSWNANDEFVGLRFIQDGDSLTPEINFPRGFRISLSEEETRRDIIRLFAVLLKFGNHREGGKYTEPDGNMSVSFPMRSYQYIIRDFLQHGYYTEREDFYSKNKRGKISWKRTIQKVKPIISDDSFMYLDFVIKESKNSNKSMVCLIHEYCVHESFRMFGWLFLEKALMPAKPHIRLNKPLFVSVLKQEMGRTFNTSKRYLFQCMIDIIEFSEDSESVSSIPSFGVSSFEHVWENMIDYVFGEDNKEDYFPHARWHILSNSGYKEESSELKPDTIIRYDNKVFVIDAKYYKFGLTGLAMHLPATDSIQKQITYGDYIAVNRDKGIHVEAQNIYNAFVIPFDCMDESQTPYKFVGVGTADWVYYDLSTPPYKYVLAILMDTRYLMSCSTRRDEQEIDIICRLIDSSVTEYRNKVYKNEVL